MLGSAIGAEVKIMAKAPEGPEQSERRPVIIVPQAEKKNGLGIGSLVLGMLGCAFGLMAIGALLALPTSAVGLGLGLANVGRLRNHAASNGVMTGIGIGLSALGILFSIIDILIINNAYNKL